MKKFASVFILSGAVLWGTMGLFSRAFADYGFTTMQGVFFRLFFAALVLIIVILVKDRSAFKVSLRDIPLFALTGVVSIFLMSFFYFQAIAESSMSVAAILLYTAPFFVTVTAAILYKEKITVIKAIALVMAFGGCVLVSGLGGAVSVKGIVFGLLSGITYASYSIFGKYLLKKYDSYTVTLWCFIFACIGSAFAANPVDTLSKLVESGVGVTLHACLMGVVTAVAPFTLYTYGLNFTEAGKASVMATLEPLTATVLGAVVYKEYPSILAVLGMLLILLAIVLINKKQPISRFYVKLSQSTE